MSFDSLGLSAPILAAIAKQGYETPSPIQAQAIPAILDGRDIMAAAQTGTGKTAGFTLPMLELLSRGRPAKANQARALVLTPTRELAQQVSDSVETYGADLDLRSTVVYGGVKINPQMMRLRKGVDILVATPGRLLDLHQQNAVSFNNLEILVLDEADRMLDMGFIHDIKKIISLLPKQRQNLLFSATFSNDIRKLAKGFVQDPAEISVTPKNSTAKTVKQWLVPVDKKQKPALLIHLIKEHQWYQLLVFTRTKHGANRLTRQLEDKGIKASAIHGNKSQNARQRALDEFKAGKLQVLVATDIAARGIDIDQLPHVINFDLPSVAEDYVHRIGRTGRAGASGEAISLVSADEFEQLGSIEFLINALIPREYIGGFEPDHDVPASKLGVRPRKAKAKAKPKKPKKPRDPNAPQKPRKPGDAPPSAKRQRRRENWLAKQKEGNEKNNDQDKKRGKGNQRSDDKKESPYGKRRKPANGNRNQKNGHHRDKDVNGNRRPQNQDNSGKPPERKRSRPRRKPPQT